jgi:Ca-activated chloride channel family protein
VSTLHTLRLLVTGFVSDWRSLSLSSLLYPHRAEAQLLLLGFLAVSLLLLVARLTFGRRTTRNRVVLPALSDSMSRAGAAWLTHLPLLCALTGLPFLVLAVADPSAPFVRRETTYPGRRICLTIDASDSMISPFRTETLTLGAKSATDTAFLTTVAAAERFVQMREQGNYRDLLALVEFGSEAYVVTPFTNDYDNILLSLSLIGDPREFAAFPDQRTLIARAIEESVELFKRFNFLDAAGNLLVIFSDGEDTLAAAHGRSLDDIIHSAVESGVPVYFVRMNYDKTIGQEIPDAMWIDAVKQTGGKFFAASDERSLLAAIREIDQVSGGTVKLTDYGAQSSRFELFAIAALFCFVLAATAKLAVPQLQKFP